MKPFRNILGITGISGGYLSPNSQKNHETVQTHSRNYKDIRGDAYPQTLRNSMKSFRNILGIIEILGGDTFPKLLEIP